MNINDNTIGYSINIILKGFNNNNRINAKVDTGADLCSLHANNVKTKGNVVEFDFGDRHVTMPMSGYQSFKTADGGVENRPIVKFSLEIPKDGTDKDIVLNNITFSLNDRSNMDDKVLLGLNFIEAGKFTISGNATHPKEIKENQNIDENRQKIINNVINIINENEISLNELLTTGNKKMQMNRLLELAGTRSTNQLNELEGYEVKHNKDTIASLKEKLKKAGVNITGLSDELILKFANAMKNITIESLKSKSMLK